MSDDRSARLLWLPVATAVVAALPLVWAAAVWSDLPDPVATHWPASDVPDGNTSKAIFFLGAVVIFGGLAAVGTLGVMRARPDRRSQRLTLLYVLGAATFVACLVGLTVAVNLGAAEWTDARMPTVYLAVPLLVPLAAVAVAARLVPVPPAVHRRVGRASVGLAPGERAVWIGGAHSRTLLLLGAAAGFGVLALAVVTADSWLVAVAVVVLLAGLGTASVSVRIDADAVRVGFGPFGWPAKVVPLDEVTGAEAIHVDPLSWGGWGYRWAPTKHATAAVVRRGAGLRLDEVNGRVFVVTVDDAERAAGLINDYLARRFVT